MTKIVKTMRTFRDDENGAAMIEYTVLLGIITVAVIATIVAVGIWVNNKWTSLNTAIANQ